MYSQVQYPFSHEHNCILNIFVLWKSQLDTTSLTHEGYKHSYIRIILWFIDSVLAYILKENPLNGLMSLLLSVFPYRNKRDTHQRHNHRLQKITNFIQLEWKKLLRTKGKDIWQNEVVCELTEIAGGTPTRGSWKNFVARARARRLLCIPVS